MSAFGRDSPDGTCTGVNTRGFPGFLQGRSEVRTATVRSGSPDGGVVGQSARRRRSFAMGRDRLRQE
jgi:hypothetical protein